MAAVRGKRVAPKSSRSAVSAPSPLSMVDAPEGAYRASSRKAPVESKPGVLRKPAAAAGVALAGIIGAGIAQGASATFADSAIADGASEEARALPDQAEIVVAESAADEAVMRAAEVLNNADTMNVSDSPKVAAATKELKALLAGIEQEAEIVSGRSQDKASRSASSERSALPATDDKTSDDSGASTNTSSSADEDVEKASDEATAAAIETLTADEPKDADDSTGEPASATAALIVVDNEPVSVELEESDLDQVVAATARLEKLLQGGALKVTAVKEVEEARFRSAWERALSANLSSSDFQNGRIPMSKMTEIATAKGHYLRNDAAIMFAEMSKAFKEQFGRHITMTDSYRSYASQVSTKAAKGWLAAPPGYSNHGWGLALDLRGPEAQWNTAERNWLVKHGPEYGWISPDWAQREKPEPWHFEFAGAEVSKTAKAAK